MKKEYMKPMMSIAPMSMGSILAGSIEGGDKNEGTGVAESHFIYESWDDFDE